MYYKEKYGITNFYEPISYQTATPGALASLAT